MDLTPEQTDRACGVLLAAACGDALGAGYEFESAVLHGAPAMIGGGLGGFAPGEWTDDTAQAVAIAEVAATGADLRTPAALDAIARRFADWYAGNPPDIGIQTQALLSRAGRTPTADALAAGARELFERTGRAAGNGSLMRTGPVALAHLDDPEALVEAAMAVSALTHGDPQAGHACVLWCLAIRHAVLTGELPELTGLVDRLPVEPGRKHWWRERIEEAEQWEPSRFNPNGWAVSALQAAWSAIVHTPVPASDGEGPAGEHLVAALGTAIAIGNDTDTVAAIAGALLGARWGASAVPEKWREIVHGWPGLGAKDLVRLARLTVGGGRTDPAG